MTATKEVSRLPRAEGEYVITEEVFSEVLSASASKLLGVDFPTLETSGNRSRVELAQIDIDLMIDFLKKKGFGFGHSRDKNAMTLGRARWFYDDEDKFSFDATLRVNTRGVDIILIARPYARNGSMTEDYELARTVRDFGTELHPFVLKLIEVDAALVLTWNDLGIEETMPVRNLFEHFCSSHSKLMVVQEVMKTLATHGPSPFSNPDPRSSGRIPASAYSDVIARWRNQWQEMYSTLGMRG